MKYLLDTHILLWSIFKKEKITENVAEIISDNNSIIFASIVSLQEIAIKNTIGKLPISDDFFEILEPGGYEILQLKPEHLSQYIELPLIHRDPFDRMLVAQAKSENIPLITKDPQILQYECPLIEMV